jgi:hypothetical protein
MNQYPQTRVIVPPGIDRDPNEVLSMARAEKAAYKAADYATIPDTVDEILEFLDFLDSGAEGDF